MDWPTYLAEHRHRTNRRLHALGTVLGGLLAILAVWKARPKLLLWAVAVGYGFAWAGHFLFERNKPATLEEPVDSFKHDWKMAWLTLTGRDEAELEAQGLESR